MLNLSALQTALLASRNQTGKITVEVDGNYWVTGTRRFKVGADVFEPRGLSFGNFQIADPVSIQSSLTIADDESATLRTAMVNGAGFEGKSVEVVTYLLDELDGWVETLRIAWNCVSSRAPVNGQIVIDLSGTAGLNPGSWLEVAARDRWQWAPEPGEVVKWEESSITWVQGEITEPPDTGAPDEGDGRVRGGGGRRVTPDPPAGGGGGGTGGSTPHENPNTSSSQTS
jgi:hypothetical protein